MEAGIGGDVRGAGCSGGDGLRWGRGWEATGGKMGCDGGGEGRQREVGRDAVEVTGCDGGGDGMRRKARWDATGSETGCGWMRDGMTT